MSELFGSLQSEKVAEENIACRRIVDEILRFGVNQRQLKYIIYTLAMNVENVEVMQELSIAIKEICPEIFLSSDEVK